MSRNEEPERYSYDEWLHDAWNDQSRAGFPAWILIALSLGVAVAAAFITYDMLPPGRYPRIVVSLPGALALLLTWHLGGRIVYSLFVDGQPRPVPPSPSNEARESQSVPARAPEAALPAPRRVGLPKALVAVLMVIPVLGGLSLLLLMPPGDTTLHVLAVGDQGVELLVNGQPLQPVQSEGRHFQFHLKRGPVNLSLRDPTLEGPHELTVDIRSMSSHAVLPVSSNLCLVRLDVAPFLYQPEDPGEERLPRRMKLQVKTLKAEVHHVGDPRLLLSIPPDTHFQVDTLPAQLPRGERLFMMTQVPCEYAQRPEPAFVSAGLLTPGLGARMGLEPGDLELALQEGTGSASSPMP